MERIDKICNDFFNTMKEKMITMETDEKKEPKPLEQAITQVSNSLKEAGLQYVALLLILISNLWSTGQWELIVSLALAYAVFLFAGWVKKIAELKINELIAQSGLKDKEILILKEVKSKLEAQIESLVDKLNKN